MAYNLPPGDPAAGVDPGFGGPGGPGGFGFPGFGKSFNLDVGGGFGLPGLWGGGFPGWASPYVPVTPLGSLWGFKGDLIVPMVAIGVALFILLLIFLAVKYALAWKIEALDGLAGVKGFKRDVGNAPAEHLSDNNLNRLADIVGAAVYSEGCSRRILCEVGAYAREGRQYTSLLRLMELVVPQDYHDSFDVVKSSAEGTFDCAQNYPCGDGAKKVAPSSLDAENEIDVTKGKTGGSKATLPSSTTSNLTGAPTMDMSSTTTPAPNMFGKFKRTIFDK